MINQEEYEILKRRDDKFKWVARDGNTELWVYTKKPYKGMYRWDSVGNINLLPRRSKDLFQFIQWEDEEPYEIAELIREYEIKELRLAPSGTVIVDSFSGSEETESEEDLKEAILGIEVTQFDGQKADLEELVNPKQLEKIISDWMPEVLSQEWIDEYAQGDYDEWVYTEDLENFLVPKQELPVIPKYVAEWIAEHNIVFDLYPALKKLEDKPSAWKPWKRIYEWYRMNTHQFVNAYLTGEYKVEEELLYYAKIKGHELVNDSEDGYWNVDKKELYIDNIWHDNSGYKTTKLSKYDWNNLGINEDNADFVKVDEVE